MQHAVNAVLDHHFLIARFDMDIARPPFQRIENGGINQLNHRRDVAVDRRQPVNGKRLVRIVIVAHNIQCETLSDFFENALRLFRLLEKIGNLRPRGHLHPQLFIEQQAQFVNRIKVARVGQRNFQRSVVRCQRHKVVPEHKIDRNGPEKIMLNRAFPKVDKFTPIARRRRLCCRDFGLCVWTHA